MTKSSVFGYYSWFRRCVVRRVETISGQNALLWGVAWLIIAAIVGWYFRLMPSSVVSFVPTGYVSLLWSLVLNMVVGIVWSLLFIPLALVRNPKVRSNELLARMLFAHWPVVLLMLPAILCDRISYATFVGNPLVGFDLYPMFSIVFSIVVLLVIVWWLMWSYQAYSVSTGRNSVSDKLLFALVAALSTLLSYVVMSYVLESAIS